MLAITVAQRLRHTEQTTPPSFFSHFPLGRCYKTSRPITLDLYFSYHAHRLTPHHALLDVAERERANKKKSERRKIR